MSSNCEALAIKANEDDAVKDVRKVLEQWSVGNTDVPMPNNPKAMEYRSFGKCTLNSEAKANIWELVNRAGKGKIDRRMPR